MVVTDSEFFIHIMSDVSRFVRHLLRNQGQKIPALTNADNGLVTLLDCVTHWLDGDHCGPPLKFPIMAVCSLPEDPAASKAGN